MHAALGQAGDRTAHHVYDTDAERLVPPRKLQGFENIRSFAALRDEEANIGPENGALAVQEVARKLYAHRHLGELLNQLSGRKTRIVRRSARDKYQPRGALDVREPVSDASELHSKVRVALVVLPFLDSTAHALQNRLGLLHDLLDHKVLVASLHYLLDLEVELRHQPALRDLHIILRPQMHEVQHAVAHMHHVVILRIKHLLRVLHDRARIRRKKQLRFPWNIRARRGRDRHRAVLHQQSPPLEVLPADDLQGPAAADAGAHERGLHEVVDGLVADAHELLRELEVLDADDERGAALAGDDFVGEELGLDEEREGALEGVHDVHHEDGEVEGVAVVVFHVVVEKFE
mmetsp:Transcript_13321/g.33769  ORF Transcript_13321/g.33769 Transcript_13321/m.33769 type:complete len:347 (+) Transcript_13321:948-1988(+)